MKKYVKSFLYETIGLMLIVAPAMFFHEHSASVEGLKYWLMAMVCGFLYLIGIKLIQRGKM